MKYAIVAECYVKSTQDDESSAAWAVATEEERAEMIADVTEVTTRLLRQETDAEAEITVKITVEEVTE